MFGLTQVFVYMTGITMYSGMFALYRRWWMGLAAVVCAVGIGYTQDRLIQERDAAQAN